MLSGPLYTQNVPVQLRRRTYRGNVFRGRHGLQTEVGPCPTAPPLVRSTRMSAIPPKAEFRGARQYVRYGPTSSRELVQQRETSFHSIISSARSRSDVDISMPRALAVSRLTIVSNFVARSMGKPLGFAPFRILSTKFAVRRNMSVKLIP